jgi:hypothetical protein
VERDAALAGQQVGRSCCKQQSHFVLLIKRTELTRWAPEQAYRETSEEQQARIEALEAEKAAVSQSEWTGSPDRCRTSQMLRGLTDADEYCALHTQTCIMPSVSVMRPSPGRSRWVKPQLQLYSFSMWRWHSPWHTTPRHRRFVWKKLPRRRPWSCRLGSTACNTTMTVCIVVSGTQLRHGTKGVLTWCSDEEAMCVHDFTESAERISQLEAQLTAAPKSSPMEVWQGEWSSIEAGRKEAPSQLQ